ncbi:MAG: hypothetical protein CMH52_02670 [Myxococcales bacterium]|nr:hypothetical protein [Myxococcales bacterium]
MSMDDQGRLLERVGLPMGFDAKAMSLVDRYFRARDRWSRTHNVAGPKALMAPYEVDLVDAVALTHCLSADQPLVDVGTGSGTPGLLVACLRPDLPVILVEPIAKRTAFLRHVSHELGLSNVKVIRSRWPCPLPVKEIQIVSRAVVDPELWPTLAVQSTVLVTRLYRMLAANRPAMTLEDWTLIRALDYGVPADGLRRVECWQFTAGL